jgi:hypothetical protein
MSDADTMHAPDPAAIRIGELFRKAEAARQECVTDTQYFSEEISPSRNGIEDRDPMPPAHHCAQCEKAFTINQTRFPTLAERHCRYEKKLKTRQIVVSLCEACFQRRACAPCRVDRQVGQSRQVQQPLGRRARAYTTR